ncbi:MAG: phosphoribosyltransferase [Xanthobacteraceae bacterium]
MSFRNRSDAGRKLADALARYQHQPCIVLALPRGGVPVAAEVAGHLNAPLDLILVRKIGVPSQPELAMGAVVDGDPPLVVRNEDVIQATQTSEQEFDAICQRELREIERRRELYLGKRVPADISGRVAIVVDDGIATGATVRAALRAVRRRHPKKLVLAVPVASSQALDELRGETDDVVCLEAHDAFPAIGLFYADFRQVGDRDVVRLLDQLAPVGEGQPQPPGSANIVAR